MSVLRELYQEVIIDHGKRPRNFGEMPHATHIKEGFNPLCGDRLTLYIARVDDVLTELRFTGVGCAISVASASLMTEIMRGKTLAEMELIFNDFHQLMIRGQDAEILQRVGKLAVLAGVSEYPARVKCATLAWHTLKAALLNSSDAVSTE